MKRRARFLGRPLLAALSVLVLLGSLPAAARHGHAAVRYAASGPVFEWIVLDAETGQVLGEQNADQLTYPASLTKMMTLYLTFEALNQGRISLNQLFSVSPEAASRSPSKLGLVPGDSVPVRELILGVVTRSANDAASVLAENLAGNEATFARYMTWKARQLGMQNTWYQNASGLPNPEQRTSARDIARLALALYHQFPREYRYFATREFDFRGDVVHSHNHLLEWYQGADGIKTGFVNASGFNLAASAVRDGHRLIGVIMGGRSAHTRDMQMGSLLDQGFAILAARQPQPQTPATVVATAQPAQASVPAQATAAVAVQPAVPATPPAPATAPAAPTAAVASAASAPAPTATAPAVAAQSAAAAPAVAAEAAARVEAAETRQSAGLIGHVATAALRHLSPVAKAEASPLAHPAASAGEDWGIQIGAFRGEAAAEQATRHVASLAMFRGKPHQVLAPAKAERPALFRARLLHFTQKGAQAACAELHRRGVACTVLRPVGATLASG